MKIYQSYPSDEYKNHISELTIPINYSTYPQGTEYELFKLIFQENISTDEPWGLLSWKFNMKAPISLEEFSEFAKQEFGNGSDCVVINPMIANESIFLNVWEQGALVGHTGMEHIHSFLMSKDLIPNIQAYSRDKFNFCNYFVANRKFWLRYFSYIDNILFKFSTEQANSSHVGNIFFGTASYGRNKDLNMKSFVIERLLSTFIILNSDLKIKSFNPSKFHFQRKLGNILGRFCYNMSEIKKSGIENNSIDILNDWTNKRIAVIKNSSDFSTLLHMDDPSLNFDTRD